MTSMQNNCHLNSIKHFLFKPRLGPVARFNYVLQILTAKFPRFILFSLLKQIITGRIFSVEISIVQGTATARHRFKRQRRQEEYIGNLIERPVK